jgi:DNA-directed RNA polymerase specialized sigma24 family protein
MAQWLSIISKHHKEWVSIVKSFGSDNPEDIVQDMYLRIYQYVEPSKIITDGQVNKGFIWFTLRNLFLKDVIKYKGEQLNGYEAQEQEPIQEQKETLDKILDKIESCVNDFDWYDKMLFNIYYNSDKSQRDLAKQTSISLSSLSNSLKAQKKTIIKLVGEDYQDYMNKDYELIK